MDEAGNTTYVYRTLLPSILKYISSEGGLILTHLCFQDIYVEQVELKTVNLSMFNFQNNTTKCDL